MLKMFLSAVLLYVLIVASSGQAPGDEDTRTCRTTANAGVRQFTAQTRILMDTFDYLNLYNPFGFGTRVWEAVDVDGDGRNWNNDLDSPCGNPLRTCTHQQTQNNWLFSQHIRYEGAREVLFNVSFRFTECNSEPTCTKPYVTLYQYNSDSINNQQRLNPSNYQFLVGDATSSQLQQGSASNSIQETLAIPRQANSLGFYLGVRDEGTCGSVERLIVYYLVCERVVDGLVTYPETSVPVRSGPNLVYDAECAANAHNTTTLQVTAFASSSNSDSTCTPMAPGGRAICQCNAGYVVSSDGLSCEACPAGMYRSLEDGFCQPCPENTIMNVVAAPLCECVPGFFRSTGEGPNILCTEPPSACINIQVITRTATDITVRWTRPATTGRPDYFYRVFHSNPERIGEFITVTDNLRDTGNTVTYEVSGLVPFSAYIIKVTTHNGVSDQDPNNANLRECEITTMTREGESEMPSNVQYLCTVILWQEPTRPNGNIEHYIIQFSGEQEQPLPPGQTFAITTLTQRQIGTTMRVRAVNGAGPGAWTSFQDVGCSDDTQSTCPTISGSTTCPTCPPPITCPPVVTCPTTPSPITCPPVVTCPTTPSPITCPPVTPCPTTIPSTQCPTTSPPTTCPDCGTCSCPQGGLHFRLGGTTYLNNTVVLMESIGEDDNALFCVTDNTACCNNRQGEFIYPNGTNVAVSGANQDFYRNRGSQFIRLHRRNGAVSPVGQYQCSIPDKNGVFQTLVINIVSTSAGGSSTCPPPVTPTCPPLPPTSTPCPTQVITSCPTVSAPTSSDCPPCETCPTCQSCPTCQTCPTCPSQVSCPSCPPSIPCPDCNTTGLPIGGEDRPMITEVIETTMEFVASLDTPTTSKTLVMMFNIVDDSRLKKRQDSSITIEIGVNSGSRLVVIPKSKLSQLIRRSSYEVVIEGRPEPFIFEYIENIPRPIMEEKKCPSIVVYVVITAVAAVLLTAIFAGIIAACIIFCVNKKHKNSGYSTKNSYYMEKTQYSGKSNGSQEKEKA